MNKRELIARVQRHMGAGASRNAAQAAVNAVLESILQVAEEEGKVQLAHLGVFEYQEHRRRNGHPGHPGKNSDSPAPTPHPTRRLQFRPARSLRRKAAEAA